MIQQASPNPTTGDIDKPDPPWNHASMSEPHETISKPGRLSPMERQALTRLISDLSRLPAVQSILLFGSRARGSCTDHSDLDVAVVLDDANRSTAHTVFPSPYSGKAHPQSPAPHPWDRPPDP